MKPPPPLSLAAQAAVAALVLLGLVGGALVVAHAGFATSPRRGGPATFVPAPEAYLMAAAMFGMSIIGLVALLQAHGRSWPVQAGVLAVYAAVAVALTGVLRPG